MNKAINESPRYALVFAGFILGAAYVPASLLVSAWLVLATGLIWLGFAIAWAALYMSDPEESR